jgi:hypothetical protein
MARWATIANDAAADSARIEHGLARWAALAEVPPAHEVAGWRPGYLSWAAGCGHRPARADAPSPMARWATIANDAPADSARIGHGLARWVALAEVALMQRPLRATSAYER